MYMCDWRLWFMSLKINISLIGLHIHTTYRLSLSRRPNIVYTTYTILRVSIVERLSLSRRFLCRRFHCTAYCTYIMYCIFCKYKIVFHCISDHHWYRSGTDIRWTVLEYCKATQVLSCVYSTMRESLSLAPVIPPSGLHYDMREEEGGGGRGS